jgi:hypothetical protein
MAIIENHKFLYMVSFCTLAAILMVRDGFRALNDSNKKEPLLLFSFGNSSHHPFKGWIFIILGSIIICSLAIKLILHFSN